MTQIASTLERAAPNEPADTRRASAVHTRPARAILLAPVGLLACVAVAFGWSTREEQYFVPHEGLGYALGIIGLAFMLLLLLYSLRKRWSSLRSAGPIQRWFHVHMALGIVGPTAILFHSNFQLGSLNANVALACMLIVSSSGVIGRFIYTRVHYEYMGRVATIQELLSEAHDDGRVLAEVIRAAPELGAILADFREQSLSPIRSLGARAWRLLTLGHRARRARARALRVVRRAFDATPHGVASRREVNRAVRTNVQAVRRAASYGAFERAFALWHAAHLPFCAGLFLAAAVHVVAVHMY